MHQRFKKFSCFFLFFFSFFLLNNLKFQFPCFSGAPAQPVPLPSILQTCGYNIQWNPPSLVMTAPYNGCFMIQEVSLDG